MINLYLYANSFTGTLPTEASVASLPSLSSCRFTIAQCLSFPENGEDECGGLSNTNAFSCPVPLFRSEC